MGEFSNGKLTSFLLQTRSFCGEKYLSVIRCFNKRRTLTRRRLSDNQLMIVKGRYMGIGRIEYAKDAQIVRLKKKCFFFSFVEALVCIRKENNLNDIHRYEMFALSVFFLIM